jgi:hypothetical protein
VENIAYKRNAAQSEDCPNRQGVPRHPDVQTGLQGISPRLAMLQHLSGPRACMASLRGLVARPWLLLQVSCSTPARCRGSEIRLVTRLTAKATCAARPRAGLRAPEGLKPVRYTGPCAEYCGARAMPIGHLRRRSRSLWHTIRGRLRRDQRGNPGRGRGSLLKSFAVSLPRVGDRIGGLGARPPSRGEGRARGAPRPAGGTTWRNPGPGERDGSINGRASDARGRGV